MTKIFWFLGCQIKSPVKPKFFEGQMNICDETEVVTSQKTPRIGGEFLGLSVRAFSDNSKSYQAAAK